jgi:hypothetical protein
LIVGTFLPEIEIWNLDILNTIEPALILGIYDVYQFRRC